MLINSTINQLVKEKVRPKISRISQLLAENVWSSHFERDTWFTSQFKDTSIKRRQTIPTEFFYRVIELNYTRRHFQTIFQYSSQFFKFSLKAVMIVPKQFIRPPWEWWLPIKRQIEPEDGEEWLYVKENQCDQTAWGGRWRGFESQSGHSIFLTLKNTSDPPSFNCNPITWVRCFVSSVSDDPG